MSKLPPLYKLTSLGFQSELLDPERVGKIHVPDVDGLMRDLLVHEEDIAKHLARISSDLAVAQSILNSIENETEQEMLQAEFVEHLGGFSSIPAMIEAVAEAYDKAVECVYIINGYSSIPNQAMQSISTNCEEDFDGAIDFALFQSAVAGFALLNIVLFGLPAGVPFVPALGVAAVGNAIGIAISPEAREAAVCAVLAPFGVAWYGGRAVADGVNELRPLVQTANQAIDDLGAFTKKLDEACNYLQSRSKSLTEQ